MVIKESPTMYDMSFVGRSFDQLCFVVEDLNAAVETWRRDYGVTAWSVWEGLSVGQTEKTYWGEPGEFEYSVAYGFAGDIMIELARHDSGRNVYKDCWTRGALGPITSGSGSRTRLSTPRRRRCMPLVASPRP
jgi:hypothetical protein